MSRRSKPLKKGELVRVKNVYLSSPGIKDNYYLKLPMLLVNKTGRKPTALFSSYTEFGLVLLCNGKLEVIHYDYLEKL